jgi:hypothetical protein
MALIDYEHFARETNASLSNWFNVSDGGISSDNTGPYGYGRYINPSTTWRNLPGDYQTLWANLHFFQNATPNNNQPFFSFRDGSSTQVAIGLDASYRITVFVGGTVVATSSPNAFAVGAWYFVQLRAHIANAGGNIQVWLQGQQVINFTGDTQNTANAYANQWLMTRNANQTWQTNLIIYDETGNAPNARTPETRIYADLPTGAGASSGWTPLSGSNWQMVDEQPNDGDTTYNAAGSSPLDDLYAYPAATIPTGSVVYAVASEMDCRKDDAGTNDVAALVRTGSTDYEHSSVYGLTASYQRLRSIWDTNPNTLSAWTVSEANGAQIGIRRKA